MIFKGCYYLYSDMRNVLIFRVTSGHSADVIRLWRTMAKMLLNVNSALNYLQYAATGDTYRQESYNLLKWCGQGCPCKSENEKMMEDFYADKSGVSSIAEHVSERYADMAIVHMITKSANLVITTRKTEQPATDDSEEGEVDIELQHM